MKGIDYLFLKLADSKICECFADFYSRVAHNGDVGENRVRNRDSNNYHFMKARRKMNLPERFVGNMIDFAEFFI